jgi:hypothetical protein
MVAHSLPAGPRAAPQAAAALAAPEKRLYVDQALTDIPSVNRNAPHSPDGIVKETKRVRLEY